jgi:hypothetical protein
LFQAAFDRLDRHLHTRSTLKAELYLVANNLQLQFLPRDFAAIAGEIAAPA